MTDKVVTALAFDFLNDLQSSDLPNVEMKVEKKHGPKSQEILRQAREISGYIKKRLQMAKMISKKSKNNFVFQILSPSSYDLKHIKISQLYSAKREKEVITIRCLQQALQEYTVNGRIEWEQILDTYNILEKQFKSVEKLKTYATGLKSQLIKEYEVSKTNTSLQIYLGPFSIIN